MNASPGHGGQARSLVFILSCVLRDKCGIYVSSPITSGRRLLLWRGGPGKTLAAGSPGYVREFARCVMNPNLEEQAKLLRKVRAWWPERAIINPAGLPLYPQWTQAQYYSFWQRVIEHFVGTIVFADGWEFSSGCAHEYAVALAAKAVAMDSDRQVLSPASAAIRLKEAIEEARHAGLGTSLEASLKFIEFTLEDGQAGRHASPGPLPQPTDRLQEIEWLVAVLGCVLDRESAIYVSCPISTGRRYFEFRRRERALVAENTGFRRRYRRAVLLPNRQEQRALLARLAPQVRSPIINPMALPRLPRWEQADFYALWQPIVERFASSVLLADGWEYSSGCSLEAVTAVMNGRPILNARLERIPPIVALERLKLAVGHYESEGIGQPELKATLAQFKKVINASQGTITNDR